MEYIAIFFSLYWLKLLSYWARQKNCCKKAISTWFKSRCSKKGEISNPWLNLGSSLKINGSYIGIVLPSTWQTMFVQLVCLVLSWLLDKDWHQLFFWSTLSSLLFTDLYQNTLNSIVVLSLTSCSSFGCLAAAPLLIGQLWLGWFLDNLFVRDIFCKVTYL